MIRIAVLVFFVIWGSLWADIVAKADSWQMVGWGIDINLSKSQYPPEDSYKIIWMYDEDSGWGAFSKNEQMKQLIKQVGLWRDKINNSQSFWILATKDIRFIPYMPKVKVFPHKKGWHLFSFDGGWINIDEEISQLDSLKAAFVYRDGNWSYVYKKGDSQIVGNLKSIAPGEGGWLLLNKDSVPHIMPVCYYYDNIKENFVNKKLIFGNGDYIVLDQNGTTISNNPKYNGLSWERKLLANGYYNIKIVLKDLTKRVIFILEKTLQTNEYRYLKLIEDNIKVYPNKVVAILDRNKTSFFQQSKTIFVEEYNKTHQINAAIKAVMDDLKNLLENGNVNANSVITAAKATLGAFQQNNDAKVTLSLINLIEILDEDIVSDVFTINSNPLNMNRFFSNITDVEKLIEFSQNLNYTTEANLLLESLAQRLKDSADELAEVANDSSYVFNYEVLEGENLNYVDFKYLRSFMLALAFELQYLSSYQLGNEEWLKEKTEGNIEYIKAQIDPAGFLNSKTFFVAPNQQKLTKAKEFLKEFLEQYKEILESGYPQREGLVFKEDSFCDIRNLKRLVVQALSNLNGKRNFTRIDFEDASWWSWNSNGVENYWLNRQIDSYAIDLNAFFDENSTITIEDLPPFEYNGVLNEALSKQMGAPVDDSGKELEVVLKDVNFSAPNNINKVVLWHLRHTAKGEKQLEEEHQWIEETKKSVGADLLNEIFE